MNRRLLAGFPWMALLGVLVAWGGLGIFNYWLLEKSGLSPGTPKWFPISVFFGPEFHPHGLPYAAAFALLLPLLWRIPLGPWRLWGAGVLLLFLGNMAQGSLDAAFLQPFYRGHEQYFHDALGISDWYGFLTDFNRIQWGLLVHSRTHPPLAILLHLPFMDATSPPPWTLPVAFTLLAALLYPLSYLVFTGAGVKGETSARLCLLLMALPAANIYGAVSLDGVIAAAMTAFLAGLVRLPTHPRAPATLLLLCGGFLLASLMTFATLFLLALSGLWWLWLLRQGWHQAARSLFWCGLGSLFVLLVGLKLTLGYDHLGAFLAASRLENPHGFRGFHQPVRYLATRVENVAEIALFLSLPLTAYLLRRARVAAPAEPQWLLPPLAVGVLLAIFVSGAYHTGETARACLFLYPYLLLPLARREPRHLAPLTGMAAAQTLVMQLGGNYFW